VPTSKVARSALCSNYGGLIGLAAIGTKRASGMFCSLVANGQTGHGAERFNSHCVMSEVDQPHSRDVRSSVAELRSEVRVIEQGAVCCDA